MKSITAEAENWISSNPNNVQVGSIWRDCDPRMHRHIQVIAIEGTHAICIPCNAAGRTGQGGRTVRVRLDRMRPTSTGFERVRGDR